MFHNRIEIKISSLFLVSQLVFPIVKAYHSILLLLFLLFIVPLAQGVPISLEYFLDSMSLVGPCYLYFWADTGVLSMSCSKYFLLCLS
jgi:hypothetical protein